MITLKVTNIPSHLVGGYWFASWTPGNPYNLFDSFKLLSQPTQYIEVPTEHLGVGTIQFSGYDTMMVADLSYTTVHDMTLADGETITWNLANKAVTVTGGEEPPGPTKKTNWLLIGGVFAALVGLVYFVKKK